MLKKTVLTFAFLTILTTFYGFNAKFSTPVTDDMLNEEADFGNSLLSDGDYVISAYDNIIRNISEKEGHDWRLMSAIAYHESRFTPDITSRSGAKGLMQIMPSVARQFDVPAGDMANPETNIWLANKLMSKIKSTLRFPAGTSDKDRMSIILACYNSGIGHVNDARRLARVNGEDPNPARLLRLFCADREKRKNPSTSFSNPCANRSEIRCFSKVRNNISSRSIHFINTTSGLSPA